MEGERMTTTKRVQRGTNHSYLLDGEKVQGATTVLSKSIPKPALIAWAANESAKFAVNQWDELATMPIVDRLERIKKEWRGVRDRAALRGTEVHNLAERVVLGEEVEVPDHLAGHLEAYIQFLDDFQVVPVLVEKPVFSRTYKYAGTFDLVADIDGVRWLLDIKTNASGVYAETALQLAAYRFADFYIEDDFSEHLMPPVERTGVIHVTASGYELVPVIADVEQFDIFCHAIQMANWMDDNKDLVQPALTK
jgi:hypothetical protein